MGEWNCFIHSVIHQKWIKKELNHPFGEFTLNGKDKHEEGEPNLKLFDGVAWRKNINKQK